MKLNFKFGNIRQKGREEQVACRPDFQGTIFWPGAESESIGPKKIKKIAQVPFTTFENPGRLAVK